MWYYKFISVYIYNIEVYTGTLLGSDTDANVYITLHGERGDTGVRKLLKQQDSNDKLFCVGQVMCKNYRICFIISLKNQF